jgi:hypothetical protein
MEHVQKSWTNFVKNNQTKYGIASANQSTVNSLLTLLLLEVFYTRMLHEGVKIYPQSLYQNNFIMGEDFPKIPKLRGREFNCASS